MGKLHTLRRAIERDPAKWRNEPHGAVRERNGEWSPKGKSGRLFWWYVPTPSYKKFIEHVLRNITPQ